MTAGQWVCMVLSAIVGFGGLVVSFIARPTPEWKVAEQRAKTEAMRKIVCPHCHVPGKVTTRRTKIKDGISGGKATGAIITAGASVWVTGLAQKKLVTLNTCGNCQSQWTTF